MKKQLFLLIITTIIFWSLTGCTKNSTEITTARPRMNNANENNAESNNSSPLFNASIYYNENRLNEAMEIVEKKLSQQADHGEALFLKALILLKSDKYQMATENISRIPENSRLALTGSCMELVKLHKKKTSGEIMSLAVEYFPECAEEFNEEEIAEQLEDSGFSYFDIIRIGKLYEQQILQENDAEVRKVREEIFLKDHGLTREQVSEISSRYLEFMARE